MAATSPEAVGLSYEDFVRRHADRFVAFLQGVLGRQAEGRGGRVAVDDTLQEALLRIYDEWPELQHVRDDERDRRLYRCLRDAAGQALRSEHGRRAAGSSRPRVIAFDFGALGGEDDEDRPAHERELSAAVLGAMVRDLAVEDADARAALDRGILVAALRALTEREAVILIAVDHLGWDQHQLSERLGLDFRLLRVTLFRARQVFYALVRHAVGIEIDEEERGRLAAYLAGELTGADKRAAGRHLKHCHACQALQRERRVFGRDAAAVLSPLPFVAGAKVLAKRSSAKAVTLGGGAGTGLLAQPGAAKALVAVVGILGTGVTTSAVLARLYEQRVDVGHSRPAPYVAPPAGMKRIATSQAITTSTVSHHHAARARRHTPARSTTHATSPASSSEQSTTSQSTAPSPVTQTSAGGSAGSSAPSKKSSGGGGGCEFFCG